MCIAYTDIPSSFMAFCGSELVQLLCAPNSRETKIEKSGTTAKFILFYFVAAYKIKHFPTK